MKIRIFHGTFILLLPILLSAQSALTDNYISQYKQIAIQEMERTGIPASITLAQGLLESNWGRSELAVKSNNHFGIKCSGQWDGETHYRYDDDYDSFGRKKKSCFRVYDHAEASFIDHSEFLTDENKQDRYGFLFEFSPDDYHSWAKGLSKAGYATDPAYANKLISIIDKYELHQYDLQHLPEEIYAVQSLSDDYRIEYVNSCKLVLAKGGETLHELSDRLGVSGRKLLRYNEDIPKKKTVLKRGQRIFLEPKKAYYMGDEFLHTVGPGEDIAAISNLYGIEKAYLLNLNHLDENTELSVGEDIMLTRQKNRQLAQRMPKRSGGATRTEPRQNSKEGNGIYLFDKALTPVNN
jgi:hypothetical protein